MYLNFIRYEFYCAAKIQREKVSYSYFCYIGEFCLEQIQRNKIKFHKMLILIKPASNRLYIQLKLKKIGESSESFPIFTCVYGF